ncbi:hypothetical protein CRG98_026868 [Punica granatum]|uniref:Uncharacterized protein n=1 Tax=Punica granatum TaxID=22663 RepID=A0A2I0J939_PUNGR|nr:hypothetical protein CRG98_026868 [Punica granatum]
MEEEMESPQKTGLGSLLNPPTEKKIVTASGYIRRMKDWVPKTPDIRQDRGGRKVHCTDPNVDSHQGPHCALLDCAAWECPPSVGRVTDTREKESPLIILRLESRGRISYPGLGVWNT